MKAILGRQRGQQSVENADRSQTGKKRREIRRVLTKQKKWLQ